MENSSLSSSPSPPPPLQPRRAQHQPPSPPEVPQRLRRQPKRHALQERSSAFANQPGPSLLESDDLYHTSASVPLPTASSLDISAKTAVDPEAPWLPQIQATSLPLLPAPSPAQGGGTGDPVKASHHATAQFPATSFSHPGPSSPASTPNTHDASSPDRSVNAPLVLLTPPEGPPRPTVRRVPIATPPTSSSDPLSSSPPWIVYHDQPGPRSSLASSSPFYADHRPSTWRDDGSEDEDVSLPLPTHARDQLISGRRAPTPREMHQPYSHHLYETPPSSSSTSHHLRAAAASSRFTPSISRLLSSEAAPATASSAGSAGTVRKNRHFTGLVPRGFYSLFPPQSSPHTPDSNRSARSSSDPARPSTMYNVSPASSASPASSLPPVSPLSAGNRESWAARGSVYIDDSRAQSETALHLRPEDARTPPRRRERSISDSSSRGGAAGSTRGRRSERQASVEYQRGRWDSPMTPIASEDGRSSVDPAIKGSRTPSDSVNVAQMVEMFPQSPARPPPATPSGHGITREGDDTIYYRDAYVSPAPHRSPPAAPVHDEERFSNVEKDTVPRKHISGSSFRKFRESIQPWARSYYADEARNRRTIGMRPDSYPPQMSPEQRPPAAWPLPTPMVRPESLRMPFSRQQELIAEYRETRGSPAASGPRAPRRHNLSLIIPSNPSTPQKPRRKPVPSRVEDSWVEDSRVEDSLVEDSPPLARPAQAYTTNPLAQHPPDPDTLAQLEREHHRQLVAQRRQTTATSPGDWSPHLWHNRHSVAERRRTFIAPSMDESLEGMGPTRRNLQIWLFAIGFVFPPAWIIAALLPLPPAPPPVGSLPPNASAFERDLEKALVPADLARHENARWWRRINRFMVPVAILLIIAIIVLVVVGLRYESNRHH